jgi:hypothetical protein
VKIRYTLHALERMRQRGIEKNLVEQCLDNPDKDEDIEGARRCIKRIGNRALVVVYKSVNNTLMVITAYIMSKVHKYLQ